MKKTCEDIQNILVDYADGGLSPEQSNDVEAHLERCENCRKLLEALQKSLELATVIWEDGLKDTESVKIPTRPKTVKIHWFRYAAVAASILIVVTTSVVWRSFNKPKETELSFEEIERRKAEEQKNSRQNSSQENHSIFHMIGRSSIVTKKN